MDEKEVQRLRNVASALKEYGIQYEGVFVDEEVSTRDIVVEFVHLLSLKEMARIEDLAKKLGLRIIGAALKPWVRLQWW